MQGKNRTFSILSNTVDKKRSTQSNPGNPVTSIHCTQPPPPSPLSVEKKRRKSNGSGFPNGSLSLETSSINKRWANARPCKRNTQVFSPSWPGSQAPPSSKKKGGGRGGGRGGIAGGGGSRGGFSWFKNEITICQVLVERAKSRGWHGRADGRTLDGARRTLGSVLSEARNSRGRHYSVPPAILLAAATYWPRQHSFPARSANRCISPPIPICHCPRGPSLFSVRATGVPRIPVCFKSLLYPPSTWILSSGAFVRPTTFSSTFFSPPFFLLLLFPSQFFHIPRLKYGKFRSAFFLVIFLTLDKREIFEVWDLMEIRLKVFLRAGYWEELRRRKIWIVSRKRFFFFSREIGDGFLKKDRAASLGQASQPRKKGNFSGSQEP